MKKSRNIILCIALFVIIVIIVIYLVIPQKKNEVIKNEINNEVYYTVTYSTNYDGADVIYNEEYEVVQEKKRLNEILKKVQAQSDDIFDDVFFTNHSILIVEAGINPEFNKCEITDTKANIANWIIPGGKQLGVGGAMDLVSGAKRVIIAMTHTNKGKPKLVPYCTLPITGFGRASVVITEKAAFFFENEGWILKKIAPDTTLAEIKLLTKFKYQIAETLESMEA